MLATLRSATLHGIAGLVVRVEVDVAPGLPGFTLVGLPDAAMAEARERVRGAIRNAGFQYPPRRITVNLAPAEIRKTGTSLDLAIALGILGGSGQAAPAPAPVGCIGELGLGGEVRRVPGTLPMALALARTGIVRILVAPGAVAEAGLAPGIEPVPVGDLAEAVAALAAAAAGPAGAAAPGRPRRPHRPAPPAHEWRPAADPGPPEPDVDLAEVRGQRSARRAVEIALAGGHALVLVGAPGAGKTLIARTIPGLLPDLDDEAALEATVVASVASELPVERLVRRPPFRAPHHTTSHAGLLGGGSRIAPGEVTRATRGVLFCDELPEFRRDVLEGLREPLEEGRISLVRGGRSATLPAAFTFVAAMNPCPCGHDGDEAIPCACPPGVPERYRRRISGPLRDRIDLWVRVERVAPGQLVATGDPEPSRDVAARIAAARAFAGADGRRAGARLAGRSLRAACRLDAAVAAHAVELAEALRLSGRGTERLLRVARTIADLERATAVGPGHLSEAARYRAPADGPTVPGSACCSASAATRAARVAPGSRTRPAERRRPGQRRPGSTSATRGSCSPG